MPWGGAKFRPPDISLRSGLRGLTHKSKKVGGQKIGKLRPWYGTFNIYKWEFIQILRSELMCSFDLLKMIQKAFSSIFCFFYTTNKFWHYVVSILVKNEYGFYTRERKKIYFCWLLAFKMIRVRIFDPGFINFFHYKPKILLNQHMLEVSTWKFIKGLKKLQKNGKGFS